MKLTWVMSVALLAASMSAPAAIWQTNGLMLNFRDAHTATLLPNGKVLVAGGWRDGNETSGVELFDPAAGTWSSTGNMNVPRAFHSATLLTNGLVLVAGGENFNAAYHGLASAELYDPATGLWIYTGAMQTNHFVHSATLLPNGKVLVAGNHDNGQTEPTAELYDPPTQTWTLVGEMTTPRAGHTATLLPNGKVLLAGGNSWDSYLATTDIFDPQTGLWTAGGSMSVARSGHTVTLLANGKVLAAGGNSFGNYISSMELFDPSTGNWTTSSNTLTAGRSGHSATLLPNGKVLLAGGLLDGNSLKTAELYDPVSGACNPTASLITARWVHSATLLPGGKILVAGGLDHLSLRESELYDPEDGTWAVAGGLLTARYSHAATLLTNGLVLVSGGSSTNNDSFSSTELFNPVTGTWSATGVMPSTRAHFVTTLLSDGRVLAPGGYVGNGNSALTDIYDPVAGTWSATGAMKVERYDHTVTLLPSGKVLVSGGSENGYQASATAEVFDPVAGTWAFTGAMATNREHHSATLLPSGKVLVAGGDNRIGGFHALASAELYDPGSGRWTITGSMSKAHGGVHTATLLPNGKVLVAGGYNSASGDLTSAEIYNPATGTWTNTGSLKTAREWHQAVLLPNGKVLVTGGVNASGSIASGELYDPFTGVWTETSPLATNLYVTTTSLLADGRVLVAGGSIDGVVPVSSCQIYNPFPGISPASPPLISSVASPLLTGGSVTLNGSGFRGFTEGTSGARGDSPRNFPLVELRGLANGQTRVLLGTQWSSNSYASGPVFDFPPGPALVTVVVNGIRSRAEFLDKRRLTASLTLSNLSQIYDATAHNPSASTAPVGRAAYFAYNGSNNPLTNAGTYTVIATVNDLDYAGSTTNTFVITPANATLTLGSLLQTYNGNPRAATATTVPPGLTVNFTYNGSPFTPTNPGTYTVIGTINDPNAFSVSATNILTVNKAAATITLGGLTQTYDSNARVANASTTPYGLQVTFTYSGSSTPPTNAGSYTVIGTVVETFYQGNKTNTMTVAKAAATVTLTNLTQTYDGTRHSAMANTVPPGLFVYLTYNGSTNPPVNAGNYTASGSISNLNYSGGTQSLMTVQKANATVTLANLFQTYTGTPRIVAATTIPSGLTVGLTYNGSGTPPASVGNYDVIGAINHQNYQGTTTNTLQVFDVITLEAATFTNGIFSFSFTNKPGSLFSVLSATNGTPAFSDWSTLGGVSEIAPGRFQFTDQQTTTNLQKFYRVRSP